MSSRHAHLRVFRSFGLAIALVAAAGCNTDETYTPQQLEPVAVPSTPAGLAATSGSGQVTVTWSGSSGATSYDVKRSTTSGGPYATVGTATTPSYIDLTVVNGSAYYFVVAATNSSGSSSNSSPVSVTPQAALTIPAAPAGLAATAGDAQVALTWSASTGAASYAVRRSTTTGGPYTQVAMVMSPSYTDTGLSNGTAYYYVVAAANAAGASANSSQVASTPVAAVTASITVTPSTAVVSYGGSFQFNASITGSPGSTVQWAMQESGDVGTVASDGRYTAPSVAGTYHVVARSSTNASLTSVATITVRTPQGTPPTLTPGVWKNITPPAPVASSFGLDWVEVSPVDPNTLYAAIDTLGLWKSTDRGSNWARVGIPWNYDFGTRTTYLDSPIRVEVDPADGNHLVATQGVRGATLGFWVSRDGGANWVQPQGFRDATRTATNDVTSMAVDPSDFNHILLGSHSPWNGGRTAGIMETKDGGNTWILHDAVPSWPGGSLGIAFLHHPATGQGDSNTWLVSTDGDGFWRTTNAGASWTKVSNFSIVHHGSELTYTKDGVIYNGGQPYPTRSRDNGLTWEQVSNGLPPAFYYTVISDDVTLYAQLSNTGSNAGRGLQPYYSAPAAGGPWTPYQAGAQTFNNGPFNMNYDSTNGIVYSANWQTGLWALKVIKP